MNNSEIDTIWKLMSKYKFIVDPDSINDDLSCIICKNLVIDACQSACGCLYCYKCITEYLLGEDKYCPGTKLECKEDYLMKERDLFRNARMNNRIVKLKVLCPNESCQSKMELSQMFEHLRVCTKQPMECPYAAIGCDNGEEAKDKMLTHLNNGTLVHNQLLIDLIQNLKNEVDGLKTGIEISKEKSRLKDIQIIEEVSDLKKEIINQKIEMECLKEESKKKENRMSILEEQLREVSKGMELKLSAVIDETEKIKRESEDQRAKIDIAKTDGRIVRENTEKRLSDLKKEVKVISEEREQKINNWITLCPIIDANFVWRIEEWTENTATTKGDCILSESFYSNNYKLCLCLYIGGGGDDIWLQCMVLKGDNDDRVQWPMRQAVTLAIVDQDTLRTHTSVTYKYDTYKYKNAFDRPKKDINDYGIGVWNWFFVSSSIKAKPSIVVNDSIIVSCIITDP